MRGAVSFCLILSALSGVASFAESHDNAQQVIANTTQLLGAEPTRAAFLRVLTQGPALPIDRATLARAGVWKLIGFHAGQGTLDAIPTFVRGLNAVIPDMMQLKFKSDSDRVDSAVRVLGPEVYIAEGRFTEDPAVRERWVNQVQAIASEHETSFKDGAVNFGIDYYKFRMGFRDGLFFGVPYDEPELYDGKERLSLTCRLFQGGDMRFLLCGESTKPFDLRRSEDIYLFTDALRESVTMRIVN